MKENLIKLLCCPINHDELKLINLNQNQEGDIIEGKLVSTKGHQYLINNGIPDLIPKNAKSPNSDEFDRLNNENPNSYVTVLKKIGYNHDKIKKMDLLRYSIYSKTKIFGNRHLNGIVLEVGSGTDYLKDEFKGVYNEWISLDYNIRSNSIDLIGDGQQLPFKNDIFNSIISIDVLEHVPNPDKFIAEMYRVLKPGGNIILSTPFFFYLHEEPNDYFRFSKYGLEILFLRNGFSIIEVTPIAGVISIFGILLSILITRIFKNTQLLLKAILRINKFIQLRLLAPLDAILDKNKRFAQGHFIIAKKED